MTDSQTPGTDENDVQGHRRPTDGLEDDVQGRRRPAAEDDGDDVEGHRRP